VWVSLIFGIPLAGLVWLQYQYGSYIWWALKWLTIGAGALALLGAMAYFFKIGIQKIDLEEISSRASKAALAIKQAIFRKLRNALNLREKLKRDKAPRVKIQKAPGTRLLTFVEWLYSPKTVEQVFKPIIADWRTEYYDALNQGRVLKARWISLRHTYGFFKAMFKDKIFSFVRNFISAGK
jgi:hypothetical protein